MLLEMGLEPVVLHRQADEGRTIIEKFEAHAAVGFAFILLTPDEIAYVHAEGPDVERRKEFRARPNVSGSLATSWDGSRVSGLAVGTGAT